MDRWSASARPRARSLPFSICQANIPRAASRRAGHRGGRRDLILRRVQFADGRTRAFLNDQPVSVQAMRAIAHEIVEIHGQHDERALVDAASHRELVDAYGGLQAQRAFRACSAPFLLRAARDMHADERTRLEKARAEADFLRHAHAELTKLAPILGEEEQFAERRTLMMQSEKVVADLIDAQQTIAGDGSAMASLAGVMRRLDRRRAQAPALIDPVVKAIDTALIALDGAQCALESALREPRSNRASWNVPKNVSSPCAPQHANTRPALINCQRLLSVTRADLETLEASEARLLELKAAAESAASKLSRLLARRFRRRAQSGGLATRQGGCQRASAACGCKAPSSRQTSRAIAAPIRPTATTASNFVYKPIRVRVPVR